MALSVTGNGGVVKRKVADTSFEPDGASPRRQPLPTSPRWGVSDTLTRGSPIPFLDAACPPLKRKLDATSLPPDGGSVSPRPAARRQQACRCW